MKNLLSVLCLLLLFGCNTIPKQERTLWYNTPAETWNEALPIGNGRIGAMVFGRPETERIQLNDDSMWPGSPEWGNPTGRPEDLKKIRELLMAGNHVSADKMVIDKFSRKSVVRSHQTLGDLWLDFDHEDVTDYHRELDLNNAVIRISYNVNGDRVTQ
ncbi:MAG: glycoside hydrolase family 95 protein, partial [Candidatus Marinimicrobia bacterium]|nr:glycoside hydrolase family 95 protein [Candidatus Neomarinimicrobiota bacterium]